MRDNNTFSDHEAEHIAMAKSGHSNGLINESMTAAQITAAAALGANIGGLPQGNVSTYQASDTGVLYTYPGYGITALPVGNLSLSNSTNGFNPNVYRFAATRLRLHDVVGTNSGTSIYALHESQFVSPPYPTNSPRLFLGSFCCITGQAIDNQLAAEITYYGVALKINGVWYQVPDLTQEPIDGIDNVNGTVLRATSSNRLGKLLAPIPVVIPPNSQIKCHLLFAAPSSTAAVPGQSALYTSVFTALTAGQTLTIAGLTWTASAAGTTAAQLVQAWKDIDIGSTAAQLINRASAGGSFTAGTATYWTSQYKTNNTTTIVITDQTAALGTPTAGGTGAAAATIAAYNGSINIPALTPKFDIENITVATNLNAAVPAGCLGGDTLQNLFATDNLSLGGRTPSHSGFVTGVNPMVHTPSFMVAKGGDGRPVFLIHSDSIGFGKYDSLPNLYDPYLDFGWIQRGLNDTIKSKRCAYGNFGEPGTSQTKYQTRSNWHQRLDTIKLLQTLNGGINPFTHVIEANGTNDTGTAGSITRMVSMYGIMKTEWNAPIIGVGMLPKPASADGYQTLLGQTNNSNTNYANLATTGYLWQIDVNKCGANGTSDPNATWRVAGYIDDSFSPWPALSYDTGVNRDKLAIEPNSTGKQQGVSSPGATTVTLNFAPNVGDILNFNLATGGAANNVLVKAVRVNGSNWDVDILPYGSTAFAGYADQTVVASSYLNLEGGQAIHPSPYAAKNILAPVVVAWKIARGLGV